jgi:hypothetical protein
VGGAGGRASGHRGVVVELEDGTAALDEDPRRPATSCSSMTLQPAERKK